MFFCPCFVIDNIIPKRGYFLTLWKNEGCELAGGNKERWLLVYIKIRKQNLNMHLLSLIVGEERRESLKFFNNNIILKIC